MGHEESKKAARWSDYWKQGSITSFGKATPDNYQSDIKAFWIDQFESLGNEAVILDVAAGNGAVATLAVEYSDNASKNFTVLAADAAIINDSLAKGSDALEKYRGKIKFYSSTPCEKLSFKDSSIDLVCSQYGIEYSYLPDSIPEACRVLRNGGRFASIMHHQKSVIVANAVRDQSIIKDALFEQKILDILQQYFFVIGNVDTADSLQAARKNPQALVCENKLFSVVSLLRNKYPGSETIEDILDSINRFTSDHIGRPEKERSMALHDISDGLYKSIERKQDLQDAAMSIENMLQLQDLADESGLKDFTYQKRMTSSSEIGGWLVSAHT